MSVPTLRKAVFLDRDGVIVIPEFRDGRSFHQHNSLIIGSIQEQPQL